MLQYKVPQSLKKASFNLGKIMLTGVLLKEVQDFFFTSLQSLEGTSEFTSVFFV